MCVNHRIIAKAFLSPQTRLFESRRHSLKISVGFLAPEEEMEYDFGTHRKDTPVFRDQGLKLREGRLAKAG